MILTRLFRIGRSPRSFQTELQLSRYSTYSRRDWLSSVTLASTTTPVGTRMTRLERRVLVTWALSPQPCRREEQACSWPPSPSPGRTRGEAKPQPQQTTRTRDEMRCSKDETRANLNPTRAGDAQPELLPLLLLSRGKKTQKKRMHREGTLTAHDSKKNPW